MTFSQLSAYFAEIAARHTLLNHVEQPESKQTFFTVNTDKNADAFIRTREMQTILVLLPPDKKILPPSGENYNWDKHVAFIVLQRCPDQTVAAIACAQNACEQIADDICGQIIIDRNVIIHGIDTGSFVQEPVGPLAECHYGYLCMFTLVDQFDYLPDPARLPAR